MWFLINKFLEQLEMDKERCITVFKAVSKLDNVMDEIVTKNLLRKKDNGFL